MEWAEASASQTRGVHRWAQPVKKAMEGSQSLRLGRGPLGTRQDERPRGFCVEVSCFPSDSEEAFVYYPWNVSSGRPLSCLVK
jgi:hypothetical protein